MSRYVVFFLYLSAVCDVELRSYGKNDPMVERLSYIKANGVQRDFTVPDRGINIGILQWNGVDCEVVDMRTYDTYINGPANGLRDWLNSLETGTMVVAVTVDEAAKYIDPAVDALTALGVDTTDLAFRWRMAFVAYVGAPADAQVLVESPGDPAILSFQLTCELSNMH